MKFNDPETGRWASTNPVQDFYFKKMMNKNPVFDEDEKVLYYSKIAEEDKDGLQISITEALEQIKIGSVLINKARQSKSILYDVIKVNKLPAVMWNKSGKYVYFDFDFKTGNNEHNPELNSSELEILKLKLIKTGYVFACWQSLSQTGIGCLVCNDVVYNSDVDWRAMYKFVQNKLQALTGFKTDGHCNSILRKNVLSHDPNLLINENVTPVDVVNGLVDDWGVQSDNITECKKTYIATKCTPLIPEGMRMFHRQSFLDLHFSHLLDEAIYVNEKVGYAVFDERKTKIKLYTPQKKKFGSSRKITLFYALLTRYFLNPNYKHLKLFQWLRDFNQAFCTPPLPDNDLQAIWDYVMICIKSDKFEIKGNSDCYVHFFSFCELSQNEKRSVVSKSRTLRTKLLIKAAIKRLNADGTPISKKLVAGYAKVGLRTVTKYWTEFLPDDMRVNIEQHKAKFYQHNLPEYYLIDSFEFQNEWFEWMKDFEMEAYEPNIVQSEDFIFELEEVTEEKMQELMYMTAMIYNLMAA